MPTLTLSKTYDDGAVLDAVDISNWLTDVETLLNTTGLDGDNILTAGITGSSKLVDNSVSTSNLASDCITTAKIAASGISDTANINAAAVTTVKIADNSVTTIKLADSAVTGAKILDSTLTKVKQTSATDAIDIETATTAYDSNETTIASVSITTSGRSVQIMLVPEMQTTYSSVPGVGPVSSYIDVGVSSGSNTDALISSNIRLYRNGTLISNNLFGGTRQVDYNNSGGAAITPACAFFDQAPAASTYTYHVTLQATDSSMVNSSARAYSLYAREL